MRIKREYKDENGNEYELVLEVFAKPQYKKPYVSPLKVYKNGLLMTFYPDDDEYLIDSEYIKTWMKNVREVIPEEWINEVKQEMIEIFQKEIKAL